MKELLKMLTLLTLFVGTLATGSGFKVLLISMDGFRWDYIDQVPTPNFDALENAGVRAQFINNTFITKTFPCHYSIATGLYQESHGIISNYMYDPDFNEVFRLNTKDSKWWNAGNPLWVEVQRHGLKSGVYFWPGSESIIRGLRPNIFKIYDRSVPFHQRVDTVVDWLSNTTHGVDLAMLYFGEPDYTGHRFGPDSQEIRNKVSEMDNILGYIIEKFDDNTLWANTHLIVTSGHGMTGVDYRNRAIDISRYVDMSAILRMPDSGPITHIEAVQGREEELYRNMTSISHMRTFKKQDIPDKWHYKHNRRILPILGVADEGWMIVKDGIHSRNIPVRGSHGYDNHLSSMKSIFYARGPNIKRNYKSPPFSSVDIYLLVAELLGFTPTIPVNGTLDNTKDMLLNYVIVG